MGKHFRDVVTLPFWVLSSLGVLLLGAWFMEAVTSKGMSGNIASDVFLIILSISPFFLLIKYLWNKAEDINIQQHREGQRNS
jgi:lipid-A-disaccharide synthase-like uncharacterized protein